MVQREMENPLTAEYRDAVVLQNKTVDKFAQA